MWKSRWNMGALIRLVTEEPRRPRSNTVFEIVNDVSAALKAEHSPPLANAVIVFGLDQHDKWASLAIGIF